MKRIPVRVNDEQLDEAIARIPELATRYSGKGVISFATAVMQSVIPNKPAFASVSQIPQRLREGLCPFVPGLKDWQPESQNVKSRFTVGANPVNTAGEMIKKLVIAEHKPTVNVVSHLEARDRKQLHLPDDGLNVLTQNVIEEMGKEPQTLLLRKYNNVVTKLHGKEYVAGMWNKIPSRIRNALTMRIGNIVYEHFHPTPTEAQVITVTEEKIVEVPLNEYSEEALTMALLQVRERKHQYMINLLSSVSKTVNPAQSMPVQSIARPAPIIEAPKPRRKQVYIYDGMCHEIELTLRSRLSSDVWRSMDFYFIDPEKSFTVKDSPWLFILAGRRMSHKSSMALMERVKLGVYKVIDGGGSSFVQPIMDIYSRQVQEVSC